jgi:DNA-directed RNA polymerase specialized sigma24 family protein
MSPSAVRRYRAERLLRQEFESLRGRVIAAAAGRLRAIGIALDRGDLEACYAQAWHGLYTAVAEGQEILNPAGWLVLVTFRRAIEEHRARGRAEGIGGHGSEHSAAPGAGAGRGREASDDSDLAAGLDDRIKLRQLFEGMRGRLSERELQAATLCYLHGYSRAEAAARMGVSEPRMRKLMEGQGSGRPGVTGKVGTLVRTIREGAWCEEQGSLMRGLAYGILDPQGERYRLALMHHERCPSCRAYVLSLRGLAVVLPPMLPPAGLGSGLLAAACGGSGAGAPAGSALGGALSTSGAASAGGAAGGGWLLAGAPLGAKLAAGCLLALGVGAGCVAFNAQSPGRRPIHAHRSVRSASPRAGASLVADQSPATIPPTSGRSPAPSAPIANLSGAATVAARREFGLERGATSPSPSSPVAGAAGASGTRPPVYRSFAATVPAGPKSEGPPLVRTGAPTPSTAPSPVVQPHAGASGTTPPAAQREFGAG